MTRSPTVVIGVGNPMRGDDGVGPAVIDALRVAEDRLSPGVELVAVDGEATRVIELWRERRLAVVVDAVVSGAVPGTVHRFDRPAVDEISSWRAGTSSHAAGVAEAMVLGTALDRVPDRLVLLGVEAAVIDMGGGLSAPVAAAVPVLVTEIVDLTEA